MSDLYDLVARNVMTGVVRVLMAPARRQAFFAAVPLPVPVCSTAAPDGCASSTQQKY